MRGGASYGATLAAAGRSSRGQPLFLPWTNDTEGPGEITESRYRFFELFSRCGVRLVLGPFQGGEATLQLVEARTKLVPEDLGLKHWR